MTFAVEAVAIATAAFAALSWFTLILLDRGYKLRP